jgi:hypothetical protein
MASALGIAFYQPPLALWPGFGSSAKMLSAATPVLIGLLAVDHAATGLSGAADALDGSGGFLERFSFLPMADFFDDLGRHWVTDTISIKPVPGCAYVTAPALGALACTREHVREKDRPFAVEEIKRVDVAAGPLTLGMENLLGRHSQEPPYSHIGVNFSVPLTVACSLVQGRLDPDDLRSDALHAHSDLLHTVASKVHLSLDGRYTKALLSDVAIKAGVWRRLRKLGMPRIVRGLAQAFGASAPTTKGAAVFLPGREDLAAATRLVTQLWKRPTGKPPRNKDFAFPFGAKVRVELINGRTYEHEMRVPEGAAGSGDDSVCAVARTKFIQESGRFLDVDVLAAFADRVLGGEADAVGVGVRPG